MDRELNNELSVIGGGLAGSEAAWQAAERGIKVRLFEMRPNVSTGAHRTANLAELVCSNSLGSSLPDRASGILKQELNRLGSLLIRCADDSAVPAGSALAVDRELFSTLVTSHIENHPNIELVRKEVTKIPSGPTIIATGPLTSPRLSKVIQRMTGHEHIFFYDAIAPIVNYDSINLDIAYRASRYGPLNSDTEGDYLNCPMTREEYYHFVEELLSAERISLGGFENKITSGIRAGVHKYFEGCLPIEIIASRGRESLAYGPLRPVGLTDRRTGRHSYAVVQLRQDNLARTLYNMVGFQTNLKYTEQKRVFRQIPGLEQVEFTRFGQMHRNTFIYSPGLLEATLQFKSRQDLFFAGQITGVEGYIGNIATGLLAGINAANFIKRHPLIVVPRETMLGALCHYITHAEAKDFQPMKANLGILAPFEIEVRGKRKRAAMYAERAQEALQTVLNEHPGEEIAHRHNA